MCYHMLSLLKSKVLNCHLHPVEIYHRYCIYIIAAYKPPKLVPLTTILSVFNVFVLFNVKGIIKLI